MRAIWKRIKFLGLCGAGVLAADSWAEDRGPLALFTLASRCDEIGDRARLSLGLEQAAVVSDFESLRVDADVVRGLVERVRDFETALSDCKGRELALEMARVEPGGDAKKASAELESSVARLDALAVPTSNVADETDRYFNTLIEQRDKQLRAKFLKGHRHLESVHRIRVLALEAMQAQIQGSIPCRTLGKRGGDTAACALDLRRTWVRGALSALADSHCSAVRIVSELDTVLQPAEALSSFEAERVTILTSAMEELRTRGEAAQSRAAEAQAAATKLQAAVQARQSDINGAIQSIEYYKSMVAWYQNTGAWYSSVGNYAAAANYMNAAAVTINQTIPYYQGRIQELTGQLGDTMKALDALAPELEIVKKTLDGIKEESDGLQALQSSLGTLVQKASAQLHRTRQAILSLVSLETSPRAAVAIVSRRSQRVLASEGSALRAVGKVGAVEDAGQVGQRWNLVPVDDRGAYLVVSRNSPGCLELSLDASAKPTGLRQGACVTASKGQVWRVIPRGNEGVVSLVSALDQRCLAVDSGAGEALQMVPCAEGAAQLWSLRN